MHYRPAVDRYETMTYHRCGRSGLKLPVVSLGLWHNSGGSALQNLAFRAGERAAIDVILAG